MDTDRLEAGLLFLVTGATLIALFAEMPTLDIDVIIPPVFGMFVGGIVLIGKGVLGRADH